MIALADFAKRALATLKRIEMTMIHAAPFLTSRQMMCSEALKCWKDDLNEIEAATAEGRRALKAPPPGQILVNDDAVAEARAAAVRGGYAIEHDLVCEMLKAAAPSIVLVNLPAVLLADNTTIGIDIATPIPITTSEPASTPLAIQDAAHRGEVIDLAAARDAASNNNDRS